MGQARRRAPGALPLLLDLASGTPLHRQVYRGIRSAILDGRLRAGDRLPSTRTLADDLGLSRNTVLGAFDQLTAEGYLEGRAGSGTRVAAPWPDGKASSPEPRPPRRASRARQGPSSRGRAVLAVPSRASLLPFRTRAFRPGLPALEEFPIQAWARLAARRWRSARPADLDYADPAGYPPLREAIAGYLRAARGVSCEASQVLVVSGSQQALDLTARVLLDPGDTVWVEDPGYHGARGAFAAAGARAVGVPVDTEGLDVAAGRRLAPRARLVHVSPSHQFPLGATTSLARRLALLRWAEEAGAWIVEDDYDSEFRYVGRPLAALQGLDTGGRVVYTGTFSKVLFPSLRLGYLVVPARLVPAFTAARFFADTQSASMSQIVLFDFIAGGHFERHIRRMRVLYRERQAVMVEAARRHLGGRLEVSPAEAGLHLVGWLPHGRSDRQASRRAAAQGVDAIPLSFFSSAPPPRGGLLLGYAGVDPAQIREGIRRLARAL